VTVPSRRSCSRQHLRAGVRQHGRQRVERLGEHDLHGVAVAAPTPTGRSASGVPLLRARAVERRDDLVAR
jgi:hypothetical protein